jgi:hypothetical protein
MKRKLISLVVLVTVVLGGAPVAQADCVVGTANCDSCPAGDTACEQTAKEFTDTYGTYSPTNDTRPTDPSAANTPSTLPQNPDTSKGFGTIMTWIMVLFAWLVGVAALTLNYAVYYTIVKMGAYVNSLDAIGVTWSIMRDVGNIMLIFGFLAAGITTILNVNWYGFSRKMLPMLLVGAVFLNFSLFFAEAIIDGGNLFATQFYTQINGGQVTPPSLSVESIQSEGISNKIMGQLGLTTLYNNGRVNPKILDNNSSWLVGFMGIILFIITAFVMFALAFVLIARFVILIYLIVIAPIGFAGLAIPNLDATAKWWWHKLFEQTITAPVLLLLLYVALAIITDARFLVSAGDWTGFIPNSTTGANLGGFASAMLSFLIAMGLLISVVIFSKKISAFGASWASKGAGALTFGATAWAGRGIIGTGIGRGVLGNRFIKRGAVSDNKLIRYGSRALSFTGKRLQNRTFDIRNMPGSKAGFSELGVDPGSASTLTAKELQEKQYGVKPVKEFFKQSGLEHEQAAEELKRKAALAGTNNDEITRALSKMTTKEIEELGGIKNGVEKLVNNLSPQQFEALMKSDKLSEVEKNRIRTTRYKPLNDAVNSGSATDVKKALGNMSKGELESMPAELLAKSEILDNLSDKQRDTLIDSKERTAGEKKSIKATSKVGKLEAVFNTPTPGAGAGAASALVAGLNKQQAAKLDRDVLVNPAISTVLTPDMLRAILREDKLIPADLALIKANVLAGGLVSSINYLNVGPDRTLWP